MREMSLSPAELETLQPKDLRQMIRRGQWGGITNRACRGYAQANLAIVPKEFGFEFFLFCHRNPRPCPILDVTEPGDPHPRLLAPEADIRTDLPQYRVFQDGELVAEPNDIMDYWRDDLVGFLLGCSISFAWLLEGANVKFRMLGAFSSNIQCVPVGRFKGPMAVSLRLFKGAHEAVRAVQITSRHPAVHGPPIHIGDPAAIGIEDIYHGDLFPYPNVAPPTADEIALIWGCGLTPQLVAQEAKLPLLITHRASHMFVSDRLTEELAVL